MNRGVVRSLSAGKHHGVMSCSGRIAVLHFPLNDSHFRQSLDVLRQRSNLWCCDTHQQSNSDGSRSGTCSHPPPTSTIYPIFIAFYDAAWAVRKDGKSQGGLSARWRQSAHITSVVLVTQVCLGWPRWSLGCEVQWGNLCHEELTIVRPAHTEMWEGTWTSRTRATFGHRLQRTVRLNDNDNDTLIEDGSNMC